MKKSLTIALLLVVLLSAMPVKAASIEDWKDQILYFVFIDRFANGNKANDHEVDPSDINGFHGGDIAGLLNRLDYLEKLGVTGIWLSPFFTNRSARFFKHQPYHGYWVHDFWSVDPRFGSEGELVELRRRTSQNGMRLLLDMVVNHMGYDAPFAEANPEWFNPPLDIADWNDTEQLTNRRIFGLPDFASQKPVVKTFFKLVARHWIDLLQPDGFRLDAVKHVPLDFWQDFNSSVLAENGSDFLLLGEYLHGDPKAALEIWKKGKFNSLFDFPLYYSMKDVFAEGADMRRLASRIYFDRNYPDAGLLATFLDNHDLDRFITSCGGDERKYRLAMAFLLSARGIPVLCYGNEQGLAGAHNPEPENRRSMVFDQESELFKFTSELIELRKSSPALRRGLHCHLHADATSYAFARLMPDQLAIAVFNNGEESRQIDIALPFAGLPKLLDSKIGTTRALVRQGRLQMFLLAKSFAVFIVDSQPGQHEKSFRKWQKRFFNEKAWGTRTVTLKLKASYLPEKARVFFTGNFPELGDWSSEGRKALPMQKISDDEYVAIVKMPVGRIFEGKCFYRDEKQTVWQPGDNLIAEVADTGSEYIHMEWKNLE
jgi:glycosidase